MESTKTSKNQTLTTGQKVIMRKYRRSIESKKRPGTTPMATPRISIMDSYKERQKAKSRL